MTPAGTGTRIDPKRLRGLIEGRYQEYLADLQAMVGIDCGTFTPEGVNAIGRMMRQRFESTGWEVESRPHVPGIDEAQLGDVVVGTLRGAVPAGRGGRRVLLIGHMDTVFPEGTAEQRPFRVEGRVAYGPGVSDMKDGLLAGWYAVRALQESGFEDFDAIRFICNPDEEIGSPFSTTTVRELAAASDVCFVLEGARENGDIVSARKGVTDLRLTVHGLAAHAGVEPERGRSAVLQAAHTTVALHGLNGGREGVTVNVGVVTGGTRPNVVADRCELHVDIRAVTAAGLAATMEDIQAIVAEPVVPDTWIETRSSMSFPPMEKTAATARLVAEAQALAAELGFEVRDALTGGASDANTVAGVGTPVLDGLGPIGGADHAPGEWVDLDSVVPRTALLASMIATAH